MTTYKEKWVIGAGFFIWLYNFFDVNEPILKLAFGIIAFIYSILFISDIFGII